MRFVSNRAHQRAAWLAALLLVSMGVAACGNITIGVATFGQRTSPAIVTVANTNPAPTAKRSQNWAGYFTTVADVTSISATWQVPRVAAPSDSDSSTWIGIGGIRSSSLIQAGTDQGVQHGTPYYFAWYELLPALPQTFANIDLLPGDTVTFTIASTGNGNWKISVHDRDANADDSATVAYASCDCSTEWIEEAPSVKGKETPLANFTSVTFTGLAATVRNAAIHPDSICGNVQPRRPGCVVPLRMVDANGVTIVQPQRLSNDSFSAVYVYP
jgi:hypothetical protein